MAERVVEFGGRLESGLIDEIADSAVEALYHGVGLWMTRGTQAVLDAQQYAGQVERMLTRSGLGGACKTVRELAAVVGEDGLDLHRRGLLVPAHEVGAAAVGLVAVAAHEDPARGPVDRHEKIAPVGFIGHLRQILDVDVQEAGLVVLEGLQGLGLAFDPGLQAFQVAHAVTAQAAVQARAGNVGIDELTRHD